MGTGINGAGYVLQLGEYAQLEEYTQVEGYALVGECNRLVGLTPPNKFDPI